MATLGLADYEMSYRGMVFGGGHSLGIQKVVGLQDLSIRSGDVPIPRGDGNIPGLHTIKGKDIVLGLVANGVPKSQDLADTVHLASTTFRRTDIPEPLYFKLPGMDESFVYVRCVGRVITHTPEMTFGHRPIRVRLTAADPRVYGSDSETTNINIYDASGGGSDFPFDFAEDFTVNTSREAVLTNDGDTDAHPLLRFYGPATGTVTSVKLTNPTTGQVFEVTTATPRVPGPYGRTCAALSRPIPGDEPYVALGRVQPLRRLGASPHTVLPRSRRQLAAVRDHWNKHRRNLRRHPSRHIHLGGNQLWLGAYLDASLDINLVGAREDFGGSAISDLSAEEARFPLIPYTQGRAKAQRWLRAGLRHCRQRSIWFSALARPRLTTTSWSATIPARATTWSA